MTSGVARVQDLFCNLCVKILPGHGFHLRPKTLDHPFNLKPDTEGNVFLVEVRLLLSLELSTGCLSHLVLERFPLNRR